MKSLIALLSSPLEWWAAIKPEWDKFQSYWHVGALIVGVPLTAAGIAYAAMRLLKGWSFLAHYHFDGGPAGYAKTFKRFMLTMRLTLQSDVRRVKSTLGGVWSTDAARLLTELEILRPPPEKPSKLDRESERPRRERIAKSIPRGDLKRRVHKAKVDTRYTAAVSQWQKDWAQKDEAWKLEWADWKADRDETFTILMTQKPPTREQRRDMSPTELLDKLPVIVPKNLANIDAAREDIESYFKVGRQYGEVTEFISYLKLERGYFAPLFLINGLMTRFQEDWGPILRNYRSQLKTEAASELLELQSFEFNCWLLWGPSVPLCTCGAWRAPGTRPKSAADVEPPEDPIFYQYGFGDENNSIDVLARQGHSKRFRDMMRKMLVQHQRFVPISGGHKGVPENVYAAPTSIFGKLKLGSALPSGLCCPAQEIIQHKEDGRVILDLEDIIQDEKDPSNYYSAYIWVMFVVTDLTGKPIHSAKWKNLLPFFEHGNIADASTMRTLKSALAVKAASTLSNLLRNNDGVKISYACALDNSNCGAPILYPPPKGASIFELLLAAAQKDPVLKAELDKQGQGRLVLDNALKDNEYASCEMPKIIDEFDKVIQAEEIRLADDSDDKSAAPAQQVAQ